MLKAHLVDKYGGVIAEKISRIFSDAFARGPLEFDGYCSYFNKILKQGANTLHQLAFSIYDINANKQVCELDIVSFLKTWDNFELLESIFIHDINAVITGIGEKT